MRIPAGGGGPLDLIAGGAGEAVLVCPQVPGKPILFVAVTTMDVDKPTIEVLTQAAGHRRILCSLTCPSDSGC